MAACADAAAVAPRWGEPLGVELYDHRGDPSSSFEDRENENLAGRPEHAARVAALHAQLVASWAPAASGVCDVVADFGAVGDNRTEDTAAVAAALAACDVVVFPAGRTFLLRPLRLRSHTVLVVDGTLVGWPHAASWPNATDKLCATTPYATPAGRMVLVPAKESLLHGTNLTNVTLRGRGTIDGQGWRWWPLRNDTAHGEYWHNCRPSLVFFGSRLPGARGRAAGAGGADLRVEGITLTDSPFWTLAARGVRGLHVRDAHVRTRGCGYAEAPNTDGFNLQGEDIVVEDSTVRNGDDCVPLFPPSRNVSVRNVSCECGNGPAVVVWPPFSVPGSGGELRDVRFDGVRLNRTANAVSIKALPAFVGRARNVTFRNLRLADVRVGVAVNFGGQGRARDGGGARLGNASVSSLLIENVSGTVTAEYGHFLCAADAVCTGVSMRNVELRAATAGAPIAPYTCTNIVGTADERCRPRPCNWPVDLDGSVVRPTRSSEQLE
jgi:polygalacturonase